MRNIIACKNCSHENSFYQLICTNCKSYLRERIYNIDLWKTISLLIESPGKAFKDIIHSDHKNFIFFLLFFSSIKILINSFWIALASTESPNFTGSGVDYLIIISSFTLLISLFSLLMMLLLDINKVKTRFKDNFAVLLFSLIPFIFALIILFPIELIIFGGNLFSNNPSPFMLKNFFAYTFLVLELIILLWTVFLIINAVYAQSKSITFSILLGLLFSLLIFFSNYLFSVLLFN